MAKAPSGKWNKCVIGSHSEWAESVFLGLGGVMRSLSGAQARADGHQIGFGFGCFSMSRRWMTIRRSFLLLSSFRLKVFFCWERGRAQRGRHCERYIALKERSTQPWALRFYVPSTKLVGCLAVACIDLASEQSLESLASPPSYSSSEGWRLCRLIDSRTESCEGLRVITRAWSQSSSFLQC